MITAQDLHRIAHALGVSLQRHDGGKPAWYHHNAHPTPTISTRRGMSIIQYKSVFAHELAHAFHGDEQRNGTYSQRQEDRADKWAARLLINHNDLKDACIWHNNHFGAVADELEVTHHVLKKYLEHFHEQGKAA